MPELKESKSQYISRIYQNIPDELKQLNHWVVHENKVPFNPHTKQPAKTNDPNTWRRFDEALQVYASNGYHGIGFCFSPPYVGVDIDHSLDLTIPNKLQSYTEYSPSGKGLHVICKGTIPRSLKTTGLEIYTHQRFFTVTGKCLQEFPTTIEDREEILAPFFSHQPETGYNTNEDGWIRKALEGLHEGNIHNTTVKVAGRLWADGYSLDDIRVFILPYIKKVNGDEENFEQRIRSIAHYKRINKIGDANYDQQRRPLELFTPETGLCEYEQHLEQRGQERSTELPTGFPKLDKLTHGFTKNSIWVVGARTGIGKTSLSINFIESLLRVGKRVLFFSTEMDSESIFDRFIALRLGIDLFRFGSKGWASTDDKENYARIRETLKSLPLFICQEPEPTIGMVSEAISTTRPDVLIFDHIQRIANSSDKRYLEISKFIKKLNTLCREQHIAGIINSQLNRLAELELPSLHHLRECGTLEEEAHVVLLLSKVEKTDGIIMVDIAKNRGPKGQIQMRFNKLNCQFEEV